MVFSHFSFTLFQKVLIASIITSLTLNSSIIPAARTAAEKKKGFENVSICRVASAHPLVITR